VDLSLPIITQLLVNFKCLIVDLLGFDLRVLQPPHCIVHEESPEVLTRIRLLNDRRNELVIEFEGLHQLRNRMEYVSGVGIFLGVGVAHELKECVDYVLCDVFLIILGCGECVPEGCVLEKHHLLLVLPHRALAFEVGSVVSGKVFQLLFLEILITAIKCDFMFNRNKSIKQHYLVGFPQLILPNLARKVHKLNPAILGLCSHGHRA